MPSTLVVITIRAVRASDDVFFPLVGVALDVYLVYVLGFHLSGFEPAGPADFVLCLQVPLEIYREYVYVVLNLSFIVERESLLGQLFVVVGHREGRGQHLRLLRHADGLGRDGCIVRGECDVGGALRGVGVVLHRDGKRGFSPASFGCGVGRVGVFGCYGASGV